MTTENPTIFNKRLGAAVRKQRMLAGLSQSAVGTELSVTFQQVQKYERGSNRISVETLVRIARFIGTTPQALIDAACDETTPVMEPVSRLKLDAMRGFAQLSESHQRAVGKLVSALVGEAA